MPYVEQVVLFTQGFAGKNLFFLAPCAEPTGFQVEALFPQLLGPKVAALLTIPATLLRHLALRVFETTTYEEFLHVRKLPQFPAFSTAHCALSEAFGCRIFAGQALALLCPAFPILIRAIRAFLASQKALPGGVFTTPGANPLHSNPRGVVLFSTG
jgi:hypothetical protein